MSFCRSFSTVAVLAALVLGGCASVPTAAPEPVDAMRPTRVVLRDFAVDPDDVRIDAAASAGRGTAIPPGAAEQFRVLDARTARDMVATTLAFRLRQLGFEVARGPGSPTGEAGDLIIDGRLDRIDEGDRLRRRANPDAGHAEVAGQMRVLVARSGGGVVEIATFQDGSDGNRPPGLPGAAAAEAAALAGGGVRARELLQASVSAESRRLGNAFGDRIKLLFAAKGWLAPGA